MSQQPESRAHHFDGAHAFPCPSGQCSHNLGAHSLHPLSRRKGEPSRIVCEHCACGWRPYDAPPLHWLHALLLTLAAILFAGCALHFLGTP